MGPALVTTGLLAFIAAWNEFLFALTFTLSDEKRTVPVAIALISGATPVRAALGQHHGGLGDRHRAAGRSGPDLPAPDRLRPHRRRASRAERRMASDAAVRHRTARQPRVRTTRLVARRGDLPDLSAQLPGQQRRRRRRPAGHHPPARLCRRARRRRDLDLAVLQVADEGLRLRRRRLHATSTRCSARSPISTRCSPRPTASASR